MSDVTGPVTGLEDRGRALSTLSSKVGIVTGAGSGIGRASALALARRGASVIVADINADGGEETVELIAAEGGAATATVADVGIESDVAAAVQLAVDTYGSLHLLHNNAADVMIIQRDGDVIGMETEVWDRTMQINLRGPMLGCKHAIPHMIAAGGGAIVTTSSTSGQFGDLSRVVYGVPRPASIRSSATSRRSTASRTSAATPSPPVWSRRPRLSRTCPPTRSPCSSATT